MPSIITYYSTAGIDKLFRLCWWWACTMNSTQYSVTQTTATNYYIHRSIQSLTLITTSLHSTVSWMDESPLSNLNLELVLVQCSQSWIHHLIYFYIMRMRLLSILNHDFFPTLLCHSPSLFPFIISIHSAITAIPLPPLLGLLSLPSSSRYNNYITCHSRELIKVRTCGWYYYKAPNWRDGPVPIHYNLIKSNQIELNAPSSQVLVANPSLTLIPPSHQQQHQYPTYHRTRRPRKRPSCKLFRGTRRRWYVPLASYNHGTRWFTILWRSILPRHPFPCWLSIQASQGTLHHPHLPLQH